MLPKEKHSMLGSERGVAPILNWENTPFVIQICIFKNPREFSNVIYNCFKKKSGFKNLKYDASLSNMPCNPHLSSNLSKYYDKLFSLTDYLPRTITSTFLTELFLLENYTYQKSLF